MRRYGQANIEFQAGSGNVFADLGLEGADELAFRAKIGYHVYQILKSKTLDRRAIASQLGIDLPAASHLMNGHFSRFTVDRLFRFLNRLDRKVTICVSPRQPGEPYQEVGFDL